MNGFFLFAALSGFSCVLLGAIGDHGLHLQPDSFRSMVFHIGLRYQMWHSLAILVLSLQPRKLKLRMAMGFFTLGILFFSGAIYLHIITAIKVFAYFAPIGGSAFLIGWLCLAWAACKSVVNL